MTIQQRSGSATVEFTLMVSLLTGIGILIMSLMTSQDSTSQIGINAGQNAAITAIQND